MKQYITLPNSNRVSLGAYARVWRQLKTMPPDQEVKGWTSHPERVAVILRAMRAGLHDRINTRGGITIREPRVSLLQVAARINSPRLILERWDLQQLPRKVAARLSHRLRESA